MLYIFTCPGHENIECEVSDELHMEIEKISAETNTPFENLVIDIIKDILLNEKEKENANCYSYKHLGSCDKLCEGKGEIECKYLKSKEKKSN